MFTPSIDLVEPDRVYDDLQNKAPTPGEWLED
jgi:hypothetical protein